MNAASVLERLLAILWLGTEIQFWKPMRKSWRNGYDRRALYVNLRFFFYESTFYENMRNPRAWSQRGIQAFIESPCVRATSYVV